jgi:hypothetical protein
LNSSGSPVVANAWSGDGSASERSSPDDANCRYTSWAVSSALDTSVTSGPITYEITPVSSG